MTGAMMARFASSDLSPASVNWSNISGTTQASNANQTITSLSTPINLRITYSDALYILSYSKNGGGFSDLSPNDLVNVFNGDTLRFQATWGFVDPLGSDLVTVTNQATGMTLDTFTVSLSGS